MRTTTENSCMGRKLKVTIIKINNFKKTNMNTSTNSIIITGEDGKIPKVVITVEVKTKT